MCAARHISITRCVLLRDNPSRTFAGKVSSALRALEQYVVKAQELLKIPQAAAAPATARRRRQY